MKVLSRNIALLTVITSLLLSVTVGANAAYGEPPVVRSQLHGFSMYPTIKSGEFIVYRHTSVSDLKTGDIVVFVDTVSGERVCHRVVEIEDGKIKSKGDNNRFRDRGCISDSNLLGKVTHISGRSVS